MVRIKCSKCGNEEFRLEIEREEESTGTFLVLSTICTVCGNVERLVILARVFFPA